MTMQGALLVGLVITFLIPVINGLITKYGARHLRVYLQLVLNGANGFLVEWMAAGSEYDVGRALLLAGASLVMAIAIQAGVWKPLDVSQWALTHGAGSGEARHVKAA